MVLNGEGVVLLDSDPIQSLEGETIDSLNEAASQLEQRINNDRSPFRAPARFALILELYSQPAGTLNGRRVVLSATAGNSIPGRDDLYVAAIAPHRAAPLVDDFVRPLTLGIIVAVGVSVLLGVFLARSIATPLQRLTATIGTIDGGDLDRRIEMRQGGEVGTLISAFNQMLDRLAETYRSQRNLLANIAHELRTPMTSIQGYARALQDGVISDEDTRTRALESIADETARMTELVEQILQLSRLESGHVPVRFASIDIGDLLEHVERRFAQQATDRGVAFAVDRDIDLVWQLDEELMIQALGNLVSNAIRHAEPEGLVSIRAVRISTTSDQSRLRFTIQDNGEGIAEDELGRIFDRFYRPGGGAAGSDTQNFGLGLAIVQEIVELHRGTISVESRRGQGTTFMIDLPANPERSASESA
ncbi:MAG: HAMP domain-containing sensor histidine kinase [Thermomicrobiales bacterium]